MKYDQLHQYLLDACSDIEQAFERAGIESFSLTIVAARAYKEDDLEIKYHLCKRYENGPRGHSLAPVIEECIRRYGWDTSNNTKLLTNG